MKTVDELIAEWTDEDRERLKDLIEDCRGREKRILQSREASKANQEKINDAIRVMFSDLQKIQDKMCELLLLFTLKPGSLVN